MADRTRQRDPEAMTADEVAALLGVDRQTVYDYAGRGDACDRASYAADPGRGDSAVPP